MQMNISLEVAVLLEFTSRYHDHHEDTLTSFLQSLIVLLLLPFTITTPASPQYIGFAEDMMLILFLVCILATLVTVHRATCYRQFQVRTSNFLSSQIMFVLKKKSQLGGRVLP